MNHTSASLEDGQSILSRDWWRIARLTLPFTIAFGAVLTLEIIAIARIDQWLPIDSFQTAARYSMYVSAIALWLRLCIIGAGVFYVLRSLGDGPTVSFFRQWCVVGLFLALSLLAVDYWSYRLQFGDGAGNEVAVRTQWLATLYARLIVFYAAARLALGIVRTIRQQTGLLSAWSATSTMQSFGWFVVLLLIKLFIDSVIVEFISFIPVVAPFWFLPNELSPMRYFVGQGVEIVAQSCGVFLYVAFCVVAARRSGSPTTRDETSARN